ncbi:MAG: hypothetical protein ACM3OC_01455 [Deltaproteobacteria bacterium]
MRFALKRFTLAAVLVVALSVPVSAYKQAQPQEKGQDKGCRLIWLDGQVNEVDWVGSRFTLQLGSYGGYGAYGYYGTQGIPQELRVIVGKDTIFVKSTDTIGFADLKQSDSVSVLMCRDDFQDPKAIRVVINQGY